MGQIIGSAAKPKRCNLQSLSSFGTPEAGEHILVSTDNSMQEDGQGNFDSYIIGDGSTAASALELKTLSTKLNAERAEEIYTTRLTSCGGTIRSSDNKWLSSSQYYGALISVSTYKYVKIIGQSTNGSFYTFVKNGFESGASVQFASGYDSTVNIPAGEEVFVSIPLDAVYLYIYLKTNSTSYVPQAAEFYNAIERELLSVGDITNNLKEGGTEKALSAEMGKELYEYINIKNNINLENLSSCGGIINLSTNKWMASTAYKGTLISVEHLRGKEITIIPNTNGNTTYYTFLQSGFNSGGTPNYSTGYSSVLQSNYQIIAEVPNDAVYLYTLMVSSNVTYTPSEIYYLTLIKEITEELNGQFLDESSLEQGSTSNSNGSNAADSACVRTFYIPLGDNIEVTCLNNTVLSDGYKLYFKHTWYDSSKQFVSASDWDYDPNTIIPSEAIGGYDRIVFRRMDIGTQVSRTTPFDITAYQLVFNIYGEISLLCKVGKIVENSTTLQDVLKGLSPRQIIVSSWNIGHFSLGSYKYSDITETNYSQKLQDFRELIYSTINPRVMGVCEYSEVFGTDTDNTEQQAKKVLFNDFGVSYEGFQYNYSCNSVFANTTLLNIERHEFVCLQDMTITHTSAIKATDYYYLLADLYLEGRLVKFVYTHLAFDNNNPSTLQVAQIQELISELSSYDRVIMMGDWNIYAQSDFDDFVTAGYTLGNDGTIVTYPSQSRALDNIIVKGVTMTNFTAIQSSLSDHYPVVATISV